MTVKVSVSLTKKQMKVVTEAVASGAYASTSEVIRDALRSWGRDQLLGELWDEGIASGLADPDETIEDIKRAARRSKRKRA